MKTSAGTEIVVDSLGAKTYIIYLCNGSIGIYDKASDTRTLYQVTGDVNALKGPEGVHVIFDAPKVNFEKNISVPIGASFETRNEGCKL